MAITKLPSLLVEKIRTFLVSYRQEVAAKRSKPRTDPRPPVHLSGGLECLMDPTTANALNTATVVLRKRSSKAKNSPYEGVPLSNYRLGPGDVRPEVFDWICHYLYLKNCPIELATIVANKIATTMSAASTFSPETVDGASRSPALVELSTTTSIESPVPSLEVQKPAAESDRSSLPSALCSLDLARQSRELVDEYLDELGANADQAVAMVNEYLTDDGTEAATPPFTASIHAMKNRRPTMEDRHVIIHNLNKALNLDLPKTYSYYAIFDGHAGLDAASYATAHLHHYLVESEPFKRGLIEQAFQEAFKKTDALYIKRCKEDGVDKLRPSGTTALCALIENNKTVYLAWAGDSQAVLVRNGQHEEIMLPHKPDLESERIRIQEQGGFVIYADTWRVNGVLSVSRAIGDPEHKALIIADPSFSQFDIDCTLDFLVLGCDGLFDHLTGQDITSHVFEFLCKNENRDPEQVMQDVSGYLSTMAVQEGSCDNITSIVIFFKPFEQLVATGFTAVGAENGQSLDSAAAATLPTTNGGHFPYTDFSELPLGTSFKLPTTTTGDDESKAFEPGMPELKPEPPSTTQEDLLQPENDRASDVLEEVELEEEEEEGELGAADDCQDEFDFVPQKTVGQIMDMMQQVGDSSSLEQPSMIIIDDFHGKKVPEEDGLDNNNYLLNNTNPFMNDDSPNQSNVHLEPPVQPEQTAEVPVGNLMEFSSTDLFSNGTAPDCAASELAVPMSTGSEPLSSNVEPENGHDLFVSQQEEPSNQSLELKPELQTGHPEDANGLPNAVANDPIPDCSEPENLIDVQDDDAPTTLILNGEAKAAAPEMQPVDEPSGDGLLAADIDSIAPPMDSNPFLIGEDVADQQQSRSGDEISTVIAEKSIVEVVSDVSNIEMPPETLIPPATETLILEPMAETEPVLEEKLVPTEEQPEQLVPTEEPKPLVVAAATKPALKKSVVAAAAAGAAVAAAAAAKPLKSAITVKKATTKVASSRLANANASKVVPKASSSGGKAPPPVKSSLSSRSTAAGAATKMAAASKIGSTLARKPTTAAAAAPKPATGTTRPGATITATAKTATTGATRPATAATSRLTTKTTSTASVAARRNTTTTTTNTAAAPKTLGVAKTSTAGAAAARKPAGPVPVASKVGSQVASKPVPVVGARKPLAGAKPSTPGTMKTGPPKPVAISSSRSMTAQRKPATGADTNTQAVTKKPASQSSSSLSTAKPPTAHKRSNLIQVANSLKQELEDAVMMNKKNGD